ncbi:MAG: thiamine pyrophosphate-dependent dehydrogenase E1 component subunit alpha [Armatimonadota bacterium]
MPPSDNKIAVDLLSDPQNFLDPVDIAGENPELLKQQLEMMLSIRFTEDQIADWVTDGIARCPCHLGIGQEAIAVGLASALRSSDRVFGTHRSHSQFLALGGTVESLLCEVLGKASGCSKGMGGSMHLYDAPNGFMGSVPIVGATIPLAVGAALAAKMDGNGDVAAAFFGDGSAEEGVLHESLNLAAVYGLPVIFVCENNLFASHLHVSQRQPCNTISRFADSHCIDSAVVDGNDIVAVSRLAHRVVEKARGENDPFFIEAITYRWKGHVGAREDIDVGVMRNTDLILWKMRDPIMRLAKALANNGILSESDFIELKNHVKSKVESAAKIAVEADYPDMSQLLGPVYYSEVDK